MITLVSPKKKINKTPKSEIDKKYDQEFHAVYVRFRHEDYEDLQDLADKHGITVTHLCRAMALHALTDDSFLSNIKDHS